VPRVDIVVCPINYSVALSNLLLNDSNPSIRIHNLTTPSLKQRHKCLASPIARSRTYNSLPLLGMAWTMCTKIPTSLHHCQYLVLIRGGSRMLAFARYR
jgi:hypothetical protein